MSAIVEEFEHSLLFPFFGIRMKADLLPVLWPLFFSKFAGMLSTAR